MKLWRRDGTLLKTLEGHSNYDGVNSMQLSPDGKAVAFFSTDNTAKLWRRDGTFLKLLKGTVIQLIGSTSALMVR
jgi:WD40 repeat protein